MAYQMSVDDIDLDRVVIDADYRRQVIEFLNGNDHRRGSDDPVEQKSALAQRPDVAGNFVNA